MYAPLQFAVSTDSSIREYQSIVMKLSSIVCNIHLINTPAYYAFYYASVFDTGLQVMYYCAHNPPH